MVHQGLTLGARWGFWQVFAVGSLGDHFHPFAVLQSLRLVHPEDRLGSTSQLPTCSRHAIAPLRHTPPSFSQFLS